MKTRKRGAIVALFALMTMIARPQIIFAQAADNPIRGSWEGLKAIPPGDEVALRLRNGETLKGRLISVSDTALSVARGNNLTDIKRGDALKVYRVSPKSAKKATMIGFGIGAGIGGVIGGFAVASAEGDAGDYGLGIAIIGTIGAAVGALMGYLFGSHKERTLIYETN